LKWLEDEGRLLRVFTQNIDTLEDVIGLHNVCYCHGSFKTSTCLQCGQKYTLTELREFLKECDIPKCACTGLIKPDIVFFGEKLPDYFDKCLNEDLRQADCFIVIGSSMKIHPVAAIPDMLEPSVPQFLINKTPIFDHNYDVQLLGEADNVTRLIKNYLQAPEDNVKDYDIENNSIIFPGEVV
jgi:NAD-dependent SIR2 family protein deacetylase